MTSRPRAGLAVVLVLAAVVSACSIAPTLGEAPDYADQVPSLSMAYQLQNYEDDRLDALAGLPHQVAVIDLARDAKASYFTAEEIRMLRHSGKKVLAYFEIGSIEEFRSDYDRFRRENPDLMLNEWPTWPGEYFVKYWDERWWDMMVRPRLDQALAAGFDGVYLDTPLAYEEIDLDRVPDEDRDSLGRKMVDLIMRISEYAKGENSDFWIFPQNSPELRKHSGYTEAIDGIAMEELFFLATDKRCDEDFCVENLRETRALRAAGKMVLAVDYATTEENVATACRRQHEEEFGGAVTIRELDSVPPPCSDRFE